MHSTPQHVRTIVIVGGGTAGWMAAAALSHQLKGSSGKIILVESSALGTVGVGEATIPTIRRFYADLGFSDIDVIKATGATCKLGIEFKDWHSPGSSFIHPFGIYGQGTKEVPFHHYWLRAKANGDTFALDAYSTGAQMAWQNKFTPHCEAPASQLEIFDWALHFDATRFAALMKDFAIKNGVVHIDAKITDVMVDQHNHIEGLALSTQETVVGDFFIDCSGFHSLLIEKTLKTGYHDWQEWLVCDRAVAVQSERTGPPPARTLAQAHRAGWQWKIPLQHRQGNGHVFCSRYISEDEAVNTLLRNITGKPLRDPRCFTFTPGRRKLAWNKNCVAIGLSAGFIEPLESTSIALIETAIAKLKPIVKSGSYTPADVEKFNYSTALEYERVRDFIILHYKASQRADSPMWKYCRDMSVPDSLAQKIEAFKTQANILRYPWEIFGADSWLAIFNGFNMLPEKYHPRADNMEWAYLQQHLAYMRKRVATNVDALPDHEEFLTMHCQYEPTNSQAASV